MSVLVQDFQRSDLRIDLGGDPFWISSRVVDGHDVSGIKDKACLLFSFPLAGQQIILREIAVHVLKAFTAGVTLELGTYTLATGDVSTGGVATEVISDAYVAAADILPETVGWYYPLGGDFVDARQTGVVIEDGTLIVGAATDTPAVALTPKGAVVLEGRVQVLILICVVPGS